MAVSKTTQRDYNQFLGTTGSQEQNFKDQGTWAYNNIINPGLASYSALLSKLSNPAMAQQMSQNLSDQLNQYEGRVSGMFNNAGYSADEKASMRFATDAGISGAYDAAGEDLSRRAAATNNPAAYGAEAGQLARQKSSDINAARQQEEGTFANARIQGQQYALGASQFAPQAEQQYITGQQNLGQQFQFAPSLGANLYGTSTGAATNLAGTQGSTLGGMASAQAQPGFWSRLLNSTISAGASSLVPLMKSSPGKGGGTGG